MSESETEVREPPRVQCWHKDGAWHVSLPYVPTDADRAQYPQSYPADDEGPFYRWADESFGTEAEANEFLKAAG